MEFFLILATNKTNIASFMALSFSLLRKLDKSIDYQTENNFDIDYDNDYEEKEIKGKAIPKL